MKTALIVILFFITSSPAIAGRFYFGVEENITTIPGISYVSEEGESFNLAYKTSTRMVGAGVYIKDDGYVLTVEGSPLSYIPLDEDAINAFQEAGVFPDPLPDYDIPFLDYLMGYSLWIVALLFVLYLLLVGYMKGPNQKKV